MANTGEQVLTKEMKEAIARSGYLMEQRLVPIIETFGYKATPNHKFKDPEKTFVSEIDIFAIKAVKFSRRYDFFFQILLIECKNLRCPLVFFTQSEIRMRDFIGNIHFSGMPCAIPYKKDMIALDDYLKVEKYHHYFKRARIASQFCAVYPDPSWALPKGNKKFLTSQKYTAGHRIGNQIDLYNDRMLKLVQAVQAEKRSHAGTFQILPHMMGVNLQFYYPILVTSGPIYECFVSKKKPHYKRVHKIGFINRRVETGITGVDRLDVVDPIGLRDLLHTIDYSSEHFKKILKRDRKWLEEITRTIAEPLAKMDNEKRVSIIAGEREFVFE